jgi:hypothetical protein
MVKAVEFLLQDLDSRTRLSTPSLRGKKALPKSVLHLFTSSW